MHDEGVSTYMCKPDITVLTEYLPYLWLINYLLFCCKSEKRLPVWQNHSERHLTSQGYWWRPEGDNSYCNITTISHDQDENKRAAVTWLKYCRNSVNLNTIQSINQSINHNKLFLPFPWIFSLCRTLSTWGVHPFHTFSRLKHFKTQFLDFFGEHSLKCLKCFLLTIGIAKNKLNKYKPIKNVNWNNMDRSNLKRVFFL